MARSFARSVLHARARFHADLEGTGVGVSDVRVNQLIDVHMCDVWRELVKAGPPDYYSADQPYTTTIGIVAYPLPADFYKSVRVQLVIDANRSFPISEIDGDQRGFVTPPTAAVNLVLEYVQAPFITDTSPLGDASQFDGIAGYEELIAKRVAVDLMNKESSNSGPLRAECALLLSEIRKTSRRSTGSRMILDRESESDAGRLYLSAANTVTAYRVRTGNIEFYSRRTAL